MIAYKKIFLCKYLIMGEIIIKQLRF